jgi:hypothetical protein
MKVKEYLPRLKANRYTYYNLDNETKKHFQYCYNYLKKHKDKEVSNIFYYCDSIKGQIDFWLSNKNEIDYIKKYQVMKILSEAIKH